MFLKHQIILENTDVNVTGGLLTSLHPKEIILKSPQTVLEGSMNFSCHYIYNLAPSHMTAYLLTFLYVELPSYTVHEVLTARTLEWFTIPSSSGTGFVRALHYDASIWGGPAWRGSELH